MSSAFTISSLQPDFDRGIHDLGLSSSLEFTPFGQYLELLLKWNRAYNLTAVREPLAMLREHVLTSLAVLPYVRGERCLDIGSGAGIPGLILAIARPRVSWTLIDSNGKKTRFLNQVQMELQLTNVEIKQQRIEELADGGVFSTIVSRAFRSLAGFYSVSAVRLARDGVILAMKQGKPQTELDEINTLNAAVIYHSLTIPGLEQTRGLVEISPG